jgi:Xaa-Pro aminopeptidase
LAGRGLIGADILAALRRSLPAAQRIDVEAEMCILRSQKSPAEIELIRHAYRIAEAGIGAAIDAIAVGVSERAVAEGTGIDTIVATGPNSRPILARSTFRRIQDDELVLLTVAPRYEGYHGAIGRVVMVGHPGDAPRRALGAGVEAMGRRIVEDAGFGPHFLYSGMIISVDIPLINAPWGGLRIEDGYLITAAGTERLNESPYLIQKAGRGIVV